MTTLRDLIEAAFDAADSSAKPTAPPTVRLYSLDDSAIQRLVEAIADMDPTDLHGVSACRDIYEQALGAVSPIGQVPAAVRLFPDHYPLSVHLTANAGTQFNDRATLGLMRLLMAARDAAWMDEELRQRCSLTLWRVVGFTYYAIRQTEARGLPHTVDRAGLSTRARNFEPAGILDTFASSVHVGITRDLQGYDNLAELDAQGPMLNTDKVWSEVLGAIDFQLSTFLANARGVRDETTNIVDPNRWHMYVRDGSEPFGPYIDPEHSSTQATHDKPIELGIVEAVG